MRILCRFACLAVLAVGGGAPAAAQPAAEQPPATAAPPAPPAAPAQPPDAALRIEWEVSNRFRLFRDEADFQRHVAAHRQDGVLAAEDRLARASEGSGWAKDMLGRTCLNPSGGLTEFCDRDGEREVYLAPEHHRVVAVLAGPVPADATCAWTFDDGNNARAAGAGCQEAVPLRVTYGGPTKVSVDITLADGTTQRAGTEIVVRDVLIAGLGDSVAAGEGNPDIPVALDDGGFCFRRFLAGARREYFRPGRAGYRGDRACDPAIGGVGGVGGAEARGDWLSRGARWLSAACHRSLYGYQLRAALALAIEHPHLAVTFIPLACSGATIEAGLLGPMRARECGDPARRNCPASVPAQLAQLQQALALARRHRADRNLDLLLLTIGANDVQFSPLVADVIIDPRSTERVLFKQAGLLASVADSQRLLEHALPAGFVKLRAALKPLLGGDLARVVFVTYGHPTLRAGGAPCPGGRLGFDIHPAFSVDAERLRVAAEFVANQFLPRIAALARCDGATCPDGKERMSLVDAHQIAFADHGFCAQSELDPEFDRDCFSPQGESFERNPATAATDPLVCAHTASEFRAYAPRQRWIRTANDSYFTAMTYPEWLPAIMQPADIHDATWGATSAVYGGAVHPTAEGQAAMADAALPVMRELLGLSTPATVTAEPLPPPTNP